MTELTDIRFEISGFLSSLCYQLIIMHDYRSHDYFNLTLYSWMITQRNMICQEKEGVYFDLEFDGTCLQVLLCFLQIKTRSWFLHKCMHVDSCA